MFAHRRRDARGIQGDRRRRLPAADRRSVPGDLLHHPGPISASPSAANGPSCGSRRSITRSPASRRTEVRFHTCYSINMGPRVHDMQLKDIIDIILKVRAGAYSFEAANPRHEHEFEVWQRAKLPDDKILHPGPDHAIDRAGGASRAGGAAPRPVRRGRRPRARHRRRRLRLCLLRRLERGPPEHRLGEIPGAVGGRTACQQAALGPGVSGRRGDQEGHPMMMRLLLAALALMTAPLAAPAQTYPERAIRIVSGTQTGYQRRSRRAVAGGETDRGVRAAGGVRKPARRQRSAGGELREILAARRLRHPVPGIEHDHLRPADGQERRLRGVAGLRPDQPGGRGAELSRGELVAGGRQRLIADRLRQAQSRQARLWQRRPRLGLPPDRRVLQARHRHRHAARAVHRRQQCQHHRRPVEQPHPGLFPGLSGGALRVADRPGQAAGVFSDRRVKQRPDFRP